MIATKVRGTMGDNVNNIGLGRKHILQSCEESLKRLQTDYIDLYQVNLHTCNGNEDIVLHMCKVMLDLQFCV